MLLIRVRVHRQGRNPLLDAQEEIAVQDADGRLYVRHNDRWWLLSRGDVGYHSLNVGISNDCETAQRLDAYFAVTVN